jgi:hypothetical protein
VEVWRSAHRNGRLAQANAELGVWLGQAFHGARRDALASAASLRLVPARDLRDVLEGLNRVADPTAPHAGLARATIARLAGGEELRQDLDDASERWKGEPPDRYAQSSLEEILNHSDAADSLMRRASKEQATKQELEALLVSRLKTGAAPLRRATLRWIELFASRGLGLDVVKPVEKLAKPPAGQYARETLAALARLCPTLDAEPALEVVAARQYHLLPYWQGCRSLEALGKAGQLGRALERTAELHPEAAVLELIANQDVASFLRICDRVELSAFMRHIAALQWSGESTRAPQLFPRLSEQDLEGHGGLWPRTQELCFYLGPTQFIGKRAVAWFENRALDARPGGWSGTWRGWAHKPSVSEVAIRALGHASVHPEASAAREVLEGLLSAPAPASAHAARALAISTVARSDWTTLGRLLGDKRAEVREAVLLGLAVNDFNYARDMRGSPWGRLAKSVPFELIEPLAKDRSRAVAELASRLLAVLGRPAGPLAQKTIEQVIAELRSGNYTKAAAAQCKLAGLAGAGYPSEVLTRFVAPLADSLEASSSASAPIRALLDAQVDLRELWPALAGAYFAHPAGSPLDLLPRAADSPQNLLFDPLVQPFLQHVQLAEHLLGHFVRYAELRCLAGHGVLSEIPPAIYANDAHAACCVNALGPHHWPGKLETS